jgi:hypothetical protein
MTTQTPLEDEGEGRTVNTFRLVVLPEGWTPLHDAVLRDDHPSAEALLAEGADARAATRTFGVWGVPCAEELVEPECFATVTFHAAATPMHLAAGLGYVAMMARLLAAGADLNAQDSLGDAAQSPRANDGPPRRARVRLAGRV